MVSVIGVIAVVTAVYEQKLQVNTGGHVVAGFVDVLIPSVQAETQAQIRREWILPKVAPSPSNNKMDEKKAELGKKLFFDPRLSGNGRMSCATCHDPARGWADGLPTGKGHKGKTLDRATPTIINVGFSNILMWDGRAESLEDQALGPIVNPDEMNNTIRNMVKTLKSIPGYVKEFKEAYSGLGINPTRVARSIAMFQRQVVSQDSPFSRWVKGDGSALTEQQVRGFKVFTDTDRGNCITCHQPPNFTDNGFHNIGLKSFGEKKPDLGRYNQMPVKMTKGAFKTPPLWNISQTAPYFHDGSAGTLEEVVDHYAKGGEVRSNLSPNMKPLNLSVQDRKDLVAFLESLTGDIDMRLTEFSLP